MIMRREVKSVDSVPEKTLNDDDNDDDDDDDDEEEEEEEEEEGDSNPLWRPHMTMVNLNACFSSS